MDLQRGTLPSSVWSTSLLSVPSATDLAVFSSWKYRVLVFSSCLVILLWTSVCPYWPNHQVSRVGYFRNFNLYIEEKKKGWSTSQGILTTETASCQVPTSLSSWSVNVTHTVRNSTARMVQSSLEGATDTGAYLYPYRTEAKGDVIHEGRKAVRPQMERFYWWAQKPGSADCYQEPTKTRNWFSRALLKPFSASETEFPASTPGVVTLCSIRPPNCGQPQANQTVAYPWNVSIFAALLSWACVFLKSNFVLHNMFSLRK